MNKEKIKYIQSATIVGKTIDWKPFDTEMIIIKPVPSVSCFGIHELSIEDRVKISQSQHNEWINKQQDLLMKRFMGLNG
jgi:hypothetical protein